MSLETFSHVFLHAHRIMSVVWQSVCLLIYYDFNYGFVMTSSSGFESLLMLLPWENEVMLVIKILLKKELVKMH